MVNRLRSQGMAWGSRAMAVLVWLGLGSQPGLAQQVSQATIIEIREGNRDVNQSNQVFIQDRTARRNDVGQFGQQLRTLQAKIGVRLNVRAGIRLGPNSSLVVGSQCVRLNRGQVLIAGKTGRGCVGSIVAVTRGTVYIMELDQTEQARVTVLEGAVDIFNVANPTIQPVLLQPGQQVQIDAEGMPGETQTLSPEQVVNILAGPLFEGFQVPIPGLEKVATAPRRGFGNSFLRDALTGSNGRLEGEQGQLLPPAISGAQTISGTFTRTGQNTGFFQPANTSLIIPVTLDVNNRTINFGNIPGTPVESSLGISGSTASGTVYFDNGQVVNLQVNTNGQEPPIGSSLPGSLTFGTGAPDR